MTRQTLARWGWSLFSGVALLAILLSLMALAAAPARAQLTGKGAAESRPTCRDNQPQIYWITNASSATDCDATGGGTTTARCCCEDGSWSACASGGSGGTSVALDLADDASNESSALTEIATTNDNGGAFTEPSSDKLLIDVSKLRPPSVRNPRASPNAIDCEFSGSICSGWSWSASGGTTTPSSGTIDPDSQIADPIYDLTSWPGFLLVQSDETAAETVSLARSVTLDTNATLVLRVGAHLGGSASTFGNNEATVFFNLLNSGDSNEIVRIGLDTDGNDGHQLECAVINNGSSTLNSESSGPQTFGAETPTLIIVKSGNDYSLYALWGDDGLWQICGAATKTGVTTFDTIQVDFYTSNNSISPWFTVDFFRYYSSATVALLNP